MTSPFPRLILARRGPQWAAGTAGQNVVERVYRDEDERERLERLNVEIGVAESASNRDRLSELITSTFAFQRANDAKTIVNREEFLDAVKPAFDRDTVIESTMVFGDRAIVACVVYE